jgi:subtilisin family serine protease
VQQRRTPQAWFAVGLVALLVALGPLSAAAGPAAQGRIGAGPATLAALGPSAAALSADDGPVHLMLELADQPALLTYAAARPGAGEAQAAQAGEAQLARIEQAQARTLAALPAAAPDARVLYQVARAYNGVAVVAEAADIAALRGLPGVSAIHRLALHEPANASSVPLIGAPQAWQSAGLAGQGMRIGIIDTGIDYVHTMFGGSGTAGDLNDARSAANNAPLGGPDDVPAGFKVLNGGGAQLYPSAKVAGGFDFAGDAYNAAGAGAALTPRPDANPMDCPSTSGGGHGTHVAGTAAGFGVQADGSTYPGPWNASTPFAALRIGPGVAPQAQLYALRVFGCTGSTALTTLAIDWSVDPDGDGDFADRLDVINMSLGSAYGSPDDPSTVASENAAAAGVIVVASAGNSGDLYYISGSPGSSARTITVASSLDDTDVVDGFEVLSPAAIAGVKPATFSANFNWPASSPVTANLVYNVGGNTTGCSAFPAGSLAGQIVLVDWAPAGSGTGACASAPRATNAQNAGAVGIIMASGVPAFDAAIGGTAGIRALFTTFTVGAELKAALAGGPVSVTLSNAYRNSRVFVTPGSADTVSTFTSRGPRGRDNTLKPDIAAPGQSIFSADAGSGSAGRSLNGTSMAAPHIAGVMALLRQAHPDWTVEELKALAMNTAGKDLTTGLSGAGTKFAPARVGAGRVDVPAALASAVVAFNAETPGAVSVSFGAVEALGTLAQDRTIRLVNKGAVAATYTLGYDARTSIPGVGFSFPDGPAVTVPAGGTAAFRVRLSADAAQMKNTRDATVSATNAATVCGGATCPRNWLSEASGLVTLTPASGTPLRVPVYAVARPASNMAAAAPSIPVTAASFSSALDLAGTSVSSGPVGPDEHNAVLTTFELQGLSPRIDVPRPGVAPSALNVDLQYVGATANQNRLFFGLTTWRDFGTLGTDLQFSVFIDRDRNDSDDLLLFSTRVTDADVFVTGLATLPSTSGTLQGFVNIFNASVPTAALNNNVVVLPVNIAALGMPAGSTRLNYRVETFSVRSGVVDRFPESGYLSFDFANRGLDFTGATTSLPAFDDRPGVNVPLAFNQANYLANGSQGALLLHHYNARGSRAQVVPVTPVVAFAAAPGPKTYGDAPFTVAAAASTGQTVSYSSTTPAVCTLAGDQVTIVGAGSCVVRATAAATANFGAGQAEVAVAVAKAPLTVTARNTTRSYGAANPSFEATFGGFVNGDDAADLGGALTFASAGPTAVVGFYPITPAGVTSDNYAITFAAGTLTVTRAPLTVIVNNASRGVGQPNPLFTVRYQGFVNGETAAVLGGTLSFSTPATAGSPPGTYPITASGLSSGNYAISYQPGTLTVGSIKLFLPVVRQEQPGA